MVDVLDNLATWLIRWRPHGALVLKGLECEHGTSWIGELEDALGSHGVHDAVLRYVFDIVR